MKFNDCPGVVYDAITYSVIYFCKDAMYESMRAYAAKDCDVFLCYDEFRKQINYYNPKEDFYPFFYNNGQSPCAMTQYFRKYFSFFGATYQRFFVSLDNRAFFKRFIIYHYFEEYQDKINLENILKGDTLAVAEAMTFLRKHGERMKTFVRLFCDFDALIDELIEYFKIIIDSLKIFHEKRKSSFPKFVDNFLKSEARTFFCKALQSDEKIKLEDQYFSVCLLHSTAVIYQKSENNLAFIISCSVYLAILRFNDYKYVTYADVSKLLSNDIIVDILDALTAEDLTITQLSMKLHVSRTTIDRLVSGLYNELAIVISKSSGNEKYYKVNQQYFLAGKAVFNNKIDNLLENIRK